MVRHTDRQDGTASTADASRTTGKETPTGGECTPADRDATGRRSAGLLVAAVAVALLVVAVGGALALSGAAPDAAAVASPLDGGGNAAPAVGNESALTVAFVADAGMDEDAREVLGLVADEGTDVVVYGGDFDYRDDPEGWVELLDAELGRETPVLAVVGNHDVERWADYQRVLRERLARSDAVECTGDLGWQSACTVGDLTVVQSSAGICDYDDPPKAPFLPERCGDHDPAADETYVADQLSTATTTWRVCSWHLVNGRYQMGDKSSLVPASLYDACREGGAIVATGHDHTYARTYPMANFSTATVADESPPYTVGNGSSFAVVSAASGYSFYDATDRADAPFWDATHTDGEFGAFFCTLRSDGTGDCYFETVDGEVLDGPFEIRRPGAATDSGAAPLPNTLVVDGRDTVGVTGYAVTVTGDAERDAAASRTDEAAPADRVVDTPSGSEVVGVVDEGVEVYRFSGDLTSLRIDGDAEVRVEMG